MKSISFQIGSSLLYRRNSDQDRIEALKLGIEPIDLVVCNLYPFEETAKTSPQNLAKLIENIDIGGPTMIRAAAKNYQDVIVLTHPKMYDEFIDLFENNIALDKKLEWAIEAFRLTAHYDQLIQSALAPHNHQQAIPVALNSKTSLRYGENPHQKAWLAPLNNSKSDSNLFNAKKIHGKELSFNNYSDMDAAWKCMSELAHHFKNKACTVIVKHANPCGVAISDDHLDSLQSAWDCDPISSFGSIISTNIPIDEQYALWLSDKFVEIITAPSFSPKALEILTQKKNIRLIELGIKDYNAHEIVFKSISGAMLLQEEDEYQNYEFLKVTKKEIPSSFQELKYFGMICNKYLKSNSIALVGFKNNDMVLAGSGMGQPNRLDALKMLAAPRAIEKGFKVEELIIISDAFFPFRDSIDVAHDVGVKYIIQPGGSIRDEEVIKACDEYEIAMDFTHTRHFRH